MLLRSVGNWGKIEKDFKRFVGNWLKQKTESKEEGHKRRENRDIVKVKQNTKGLWAENCLWQLWLILIVGNVDSRYTDSLFIDSLLPPLCNLCIMHDWEIQLFYTKSESDHQKVDEIESEHGFGIGL